MLSILADLMSSVSGRCEYADARYVDRALERLRTRNGRVEVAEQLESEGIGVRVRSSGAWAFAATRDISRHGAERALERALAIADSQPKGPGSPLAPAAPASGHWAGPCKQDPFAVPLEEKLELLLAADAALRLDDRIVRTQAACVELRTAKAFASTEGGACTQTLVECAGGIGAVAVEGSELQERSYPAREAGARAAGWEHVLGLDLAANAPRVAEEAVALLRADPCPASTTTVVLSGDQLVLQVHESIGHAVELDRMLGMEASYAGTSWLEPADLGTRRFGSDFLNVTADATLHGGLGSFGWDDEGVAAQSIPIIRSGVLEGALSSRETAAATGLGRSGGCMRAEGFDRQPIVRMTNVSIEPGEAGTLADLIQSTDEGVYMETNRSWSIDDRRLHFQFATEIAREIKDGRLGRLLRNPSYAGVTPGFWLSLDAVCSAPEWALWGILSCGKGEPGQVIHVSHGAAPARFRNVQVGVA